MEKIAKANIKYHLENLVYKYIEIFYLFLLFSVILKSFKIPNLRGQTYKKDQFVKNNLSRNRKWRKEPNNGSSYHSPGRNDLVWTRRWKPWIYWDVNWLELQVRGGADGTWLWSVCGDEKKELLRRMPEFEASATWWMVVIYRYGNLERTFLPRRRNQELLFGHKIWNGF